MNLAATLRGNTFRFKDVKDVLAKANEEKSGDRLAGVAASSVSERVAAKRVLAELTMQDLYENPVVPAEKDAITRLILDDLQRPVYESLKSWTVAKLREHVLSDRTTGAELLRLSRGLSSEMIAACAKLMTNLDLISAARKIRVVVHAANTLGLEGRLSTRLQPNHPSDSIEGILASLRDGLSFGSGDAVIGINPVTDNPQQTTAILNATGDFMRQWRIPTQNCCLAHVTTQMKALEGGAQLGLMFQSIAGTEKALKSFGVTLSLLDEAHEMTQKLGQVQGPNVMYFETGQGSALSADAHEGADQMTLEGRNYGLARHYKPFLVNTVVGFIGPEYLYDARQIARAGLEDHFMGKLHGIPMGCDACYTNHADADQNDLESLEVLLTTAGCNFFMGLPMGDDVMLNYQSTSFHDGAALRQLMGLRPAPEFEAWLEEMGIMADGKLTARAGDASVFG
ncbi:MAG: ethanolamine ammonia-lyase large subunit [Myxococcales bacterium]|jgi:ethanolamine ammonia-lyase large subunit|nr:ethanolamine ammonia-lyase large subunit [Myxococcales bacterium]